jgi:hypothetical protein
MLRFFAVFPFSRRRSEPFMDAECRRGVARSRVVKENGRFRRAVRLQEIYREHAQLSVRWTRLADESVQRSVRALMG